MQADWVSIGYGLLDGDSYCQPKSVTISPEIPGLTVSPETWLTTVALETDEPEHAIGPTTVAVTFSLDNHPTVS